MRCNGCRFGRAGSVGPGHRQQHSPQELGAVVVVVGLIAGILLLANAGAIAGWLQEIGVIPWAQHLRMEYVTGTAITVIVMLLVLFPSRVVLAIGVLRCPVCDFLLLRRGSYCCECWSRT